MDGLTFALDFRHACKVFDHTKKVSEANLQYILDAGRKAPSAFGLEPWHFVVVESEAVKIRLRPICFNQEQITSCSHLIIILARKVSCYQKGNIFFDEWLANQTLSSSSVETAAYGERVLNVLRQTENVDNWLKAQCGYAAMNLLTAAAFLGIDSCPMEGFIPGQIESTLTELVKDINLEDYNVALCVPIGYRLKEQTPQRRWPLEKNVSRI